jgi:transglutaminase-like putative cysteine protease
MRLSVVHTTTFTYDNPIVEASTELRLRPLDVDGQRCVSFRLATEPRGIRVHQFADHLGNLVGHLDVLEPHDRLTVVAQSEVLTSAFEDTTPLSPLELHDYRQASGYAVLETPVPGTPRRARLRAPRARPS